MKKLIILFLIVLFPNFFFAQKGKEVTYNKQSFTFQKSTTLNVSDIDNDWKVTVQNLESPQIGNKSYRGYLQELKKEISNKYPRKSTPFHDLNSPKNEIDTPIMLRNFQGNLYNYSIPNDNTLAISNSGKLISAINTNILMYDVVVDSVLKTLSLNAFADTLSTVSPHQYDPKLIYDFQEDRFIIVFLAGASSDNTTHIIVGFSQTNDPCGSWNLYDLPGNPIQNDTSWTDYPAVALNADELFITGNLLKYGGSWQASFKQSVIWQVNKFNGFNGYPLQTTLWKDIHFGGVPIRNIHPIKCGDSYYGPGLYFLSNRNFSIQCDSIFLMEIDNIQTDSTVALSVDLLTSDKTYGAPPLARQSLNNTFETNDARVLGGFYHNGDIQFVANTIDTTNGFAAVYHGLISNVNSATTVHATILSDSVLDFGYPNISYAGLNLSDPRSIISFDHTSPQDYAGMSAIFYNNNNQFSKRVTVKKGSSFVNIQGGVEERWGDYTGSQRKYDEPGIVWVSGTFGYKKNYSPISGTWIAEIKAPGFWNSVSSVSAKKSSMTIFPNPVVDEPVNLKFYLAETSILELSVFDLNGKRVKLLYKGFVKSGNNQLAFSTAYLNSGIYLVVISDEKKVLTTQKFVVAN